MYEVLRALLGPRSAWGLVSRAREKSADLAARLGDALARCSAATRSCDDRPIFLLSAGWRSGSTLLQRMLMEHNEDVLIWGEPFERSNIYDGMMDQFRGFTSQWPPDKYFLSKSRHRNLSEEWIANLYPDVDDLVQAHRQFFDAAFAAPARAMGRKVWGIKEVRLTVEHAIYFRALFPQCRIIFLHRNPRDAFLSFRSWNEAWFHRWPDRIIGTPYAFGRHWARVTRGFLDRHQEIGALMLRYDDLDDSAEVARLGRYVGWEVPRASELRRVDGFLSGNRAVRLPYFDRRLIDYSTGRTWKDAGYGS